MTRPFLALPRPALPLLALPVLALAACHAPSAGSASLTAERPEFQPIAGDDALLIWFAGCDAWLTDPQDAQLAAALESAPARVRELPGELEDGEFPAEAIQLALDTLGSPWELTASVDAGQPDQMPIRAQLATRAHSSEEARERAARFTRLITAAGLPSLGVNQAAHGLVQIPLEGMNVFHGIATDGDDDVWRIALGEPRLARRDLGTLDLPSGATPFLAFKIDFREIQDGLAFGDPAMAQGFANAMQAQGDGIQGGMAHVGDAVVGGWRIRGWKSAQEKAGLLPSGPLSRAAIELVPSDAAWAMLGRFNPRGMLAMVRAAAAQSAAQFDMPEGSDPIAMLRDLAGFDLDADLVAHLGETWGVYRADSTGGAGWLSTVAFMEVRDAAGLASTLEDLESRLDGLSIQFARGYVRVRREKQGDVELRVLSLTGLPVPLQLSWAQAHGYWWLAATPQALTAALTHAGARGDSLLDAPAFRALSDGDVDGVYGLSFTANERYARDGFTPVALLGSAVSNALASPSATDRTPLVIVPCFDELVRGARAAGSFSRIADGDLVITASTDGSLLVNAASMMGWLGEMPWLVAGLGGIGAVWGGQRMDASVVPEVEVFGADDSGMVDEPLPMDEDVVEPAPEDTPPEPKDGDPK